MPSTVVVGGFWGDEGKGKIISYLAVEDKIHIGVRGGVGPNAGHTVIHRGQRFKMRMLPSTFLNPECRLLVGPGVLVNPQVFLEEVKLTNSEHRAALDGNCAMIEPRHVEADKGSGYLSKTIGTTGTGTGPCNMDRVQRVAKTAKDMPELARFIADVAGEVNEALDAGRNVLVEGTQGTHLSVYHGTYPYCTSKDVAAASICGDVGIGPKRVDEVLVVFKGYVTRVGGGDLPGELSTEEAEKRGWLEVATVTGRTRRSAPFNMELAKRSVMLNSATQAAITKFDAVFPECKGVKNADGLSSPAKRFVEEVESQLKIPVTLIGTGPDLEDIVDLRRKT
ncbi:MAG: adenylosuccinate synthetase [Candidatus Bathyarchaeia archaeon]